MESKLVYHTARHLIDNRFSSAKEMAAHLGISYPALNRLLNGQNTQKDAQNIMDGIARFCLDEQIPPEEILPHSFFD